MTAASISALVIAAPAVLISSAAAGPAPAGCVDSGGNGEINNGETITCISASPVSEITSVLDPADPAQNAFDLTVVIGDATTPTNLVGSPGAAAGIFLREGRAVYVNNAYSSVTGDDYGVYIATATYDPYGVTIISEGRIEGTNGFGIRTSNAGYGDTVIDVVDVAGARGGIRARDYVPFSRDLSITSTGSVSSADGHGVNALNSGLGSTYINVVDVTGGSTSDDGVNAVNAGVDLTIVSTGGVYGSAAGVRAENNGSGATTLSLNDVDALLDAIVVDAAASTTGDVSVTATGAITAGRDGVLLTQDGTGATSLSVDTIVARDAIVVRTAATTTGDVSVTATGAITASRDGAVLWHDGTGAASFSVDTIDAGQFGVFLDVDAAATGDLSLTATGAITAGRDGVRARQYGAGSIAFNLAGVAAGGGFSDDGIDVENDGVDIDIVSTGMISAGGRGVSAINRGTGATSISVDDVNATNEAIRIQSAASTTGDVVVTATGALTSANRYGAFVNQQGTGAVSVSVNDVTADDDGVRAFADGGDIAVTATGTIMAGRTGVRVSTYPAGAIDISVNAVNALNRAIDAYNAGDDISVTATGAITAQNDAIVVEQYNNASVTGVDGVSIAVDSITAGRRAIAVTSSSYITGDVSVTATGAIDAGRGAVFVNNRGAGDTGVNVADVTAGAGGSDIGVQVVHSGADLTVVSTGTISAGNTGVWTDHRGTGDTAISVNSIDAGATGIDAVFGDPGTSGDLTVTATGQIDAGSVGVGAINLGTGGIDISVNGVDAVQYAVFIYAATGGSGDVSLTATGAVVSQDYSSVSVYQYGAGDTTINVADVTTLDLESPALNIIHRGGDLSLTATGAIASGDTGVVADHTGTGAATISVNSIDAGNRGVSLTAGAAAGHVFVTATGAITADANGIDIEQNGAGDTIVSVADVAAAGYLGPNHGIGVNHLGRDLVIVSSGTITTRARGVVADNVGTGATRIEVNNIDADATGISVLNAVTGAGADFSITATGLIEAGLRGVDALNLGDGDVTVSVNAVNAVSRALNISNAAGGTDDVTVTATGAVTSQIGDAIYVTQSSAGDTMINVADVTAGVGADDDAIHVDHRGGDLAVTSTGTLTAGGAGVLADHTGTGAASVVSTGTITAGGDGVSVLRDGSSLADISVYVATVTGGDNGVDVSNTNGGVSITLAGAVTGEGGEGIVAVASTGTEITINSGGSVTGVTSAIRLDDTAGDVVTLNGGGSIAGDALLLGGDDVFNDAGGQFTIVFGGDGTDTVNFEAGGARTIFGSGGAEDALQEFEVFNFNAGGFTLVGAHTGLSETNFNAGVNTLTGTLTSTETTVAEGATLNKADGSVINGLLTVNGTLSIGNSPGVSTVDGDVVFGPASVLPIETLGDTHDMLIVTGSVTLDGALQIIHLGDLEVGTTRRTIIDGDRDIIGSHATISGEEGLLISNSVDFDPSGFDLILTTTVNSALSVDGLTGDELNVGEHLVGLLAQPSLDLELAGVINAVGAIPNVEDLRAVLAELHPEGFDGGLRYLANSQGRFMSNLIDGPVHAARRAGPDGAHVWAAVDLSRLSRNDEPRHVGFEGDAYEFSAGLSGLGRGPLRLGFAGGYARFEGDTKARLTDAIDVSLYRLAASARMTMDGAGANGHIDTVVSIAKGENELAMRLIDPVSDAQITQSGRADIRSIGFATRFTVTGANGRDWPVRPHAEIGLDAVRQDAVDVRGAEAGATALAVNKLDSTRAHIALGAAFDRYVSKSLSLNASIEGVRYFSDTENVIEARFAAAPDDVPAFRTIGASVEWQARMRAGASYAHKSGFVLSADAFGEAGDLTVYGARVELSRRF